LIEKGGLSIQSDEVIGVAVETGCQFRKSVAYPEELDGGLTVAKLGNSR
jgi:acyl-CoA thioester hydrolase